MLDHYLTRERDQLLPRIRPNTGQTADMTKAASRCFEWADTLQSRRRELARDPSLSAEDRRQELTRIATEEMLPDLAGVVEPAKRAKAIVAAERKNLRPGVNLDKGTAGLFGDAAVVDAALYFVKREVRGIDGVSESDLDMLTQPGAPG